MQEGWGGRSGEHAFKDFSSAGLEEVRQAGGAGSMEGLRLLRETERGAGERAEEEEPGSPRRCLPRSHGGVQLSYGTNVCLSSFLTRT